MSENGASNVKSSFFAVKRLMCWARKVYYQGKIGEEDEDNTLITQGFVTTAFNSTASTKGSRNAMSLIHE
jgi:hypothetical protein